MKEAIHTVVAVVGAVVDFEVMEKPTIKPLDSRVFALELASNLREGFFQPKCNHP